MNARMVIAISVKLDHKKIYHLAHQKVFYLFSILLNNTPYIHSIFLPIQYSFFVIIIFYSIQERIE